MKQIIEPGQATEMYRRDQRAHVLLRLIEGTKNIEGLEGKTVKEVFSREENIRNLARSLSSSGYISLISGINGILRGRPKEEWRVSRETVLAGAPLAVDIAIFPRPEDKQLLLREAWEGAREMEKDGRSLQEIAMLLGSTLVQIHPFPDGNGRTSRTVQFLVGNGYSIGNMKELKDVLGGEGRDVMDTYAEEIKMQIESLAMFSEITDPKKIRKS